MPNSATPWLALPLADLTPDGPSNADWVLFALAVVIVVGLHFWRRGLSRPRQKIYDGGVIGVGVLLYLLASLPDDFSASTQTALGLAALVLLAAALALGAWIFFQRRKSKSP